jgi:hypothetical protein
VKPVLTRIIAKIVYPTIILTIIHNNVLIFVRNIIFKTVEFVMNAQQIALNVPVFSISAQNVKVLYFYKILFVLQNVIQIFIPTLLIFVFSVQVLALPAKTNLHLVFHVTKILCINISGIFLVL